MLILGAKPFTFFPNTLVRDKKKEVGMSGTFGYGRAPFLFLPQPARLVALKVSEAGQVVCLNCTAAAS
jgi:hypothetical protein